MIKLSESKVALVNLKGTIEALEQIKSLIDSYKEDKAGPAYCSFDHVYRTEAKVQFNRPIMVKALEEQKEVLVNYLANLGIDAKEEI